MKQKSMHLSLSAILLVLFLCFAGQGFAIEEQQINTIYLLNGEINIPGDPAEINWKNLSGVGFQLMTFTGQDPLVQDGVFISGSFRNNILKGNAVVSCSGPMDVPVDFGTNMIHPEDLLFTRFRQNTISWPNLTNINAEVEFLPDSLQLNGALESGTFVPGDGISFDASLKIAEDFVYQTRMALS